MPILNMPRSTLDNNYVLNLNKIVRRHMLKDKRKRLKVAQEKIALVSGRGFAAASTPKEA